MNPIILDDIRQQVPDQILELPQWVNHDANKVPFNPTSPYHKASTINPSSWGTFSQAAKNVECGIQPGVGFVFNGKGIVGIDLDKLTTDTAKAEAIDLVRRCGTYAESSPSGNGIHIIGQGHLAGTGIKKAWIEIYDRARYFTVTGKRLECAPKKLNDIQGIVDQLEFEFDTTKIPEEPLPTNQPEELNKSDRQILKLLRRGKHKDTFNSLYYDSSRSRTFTHNYPSHSEADLALCRIISFYTRDANQITRIFASSALYRSKWERQDYRDSIIIKVLNS